MNFWPLNQHLHIFPIPQPLRHPLPLCFHGLDCFSSNRITLPRLGFEKTVPSTCHFYLSLFASSSTRLSAVLWGGLGSLVRKWDPPFQQTARSWSFLRTTGTSFEANVLSPIWVLRYSLDLQLDSNLMRNLGARGTQLSCVQIPDL